MSTLTYAVRGLHGESLFLKPVMVPLRNGVEWKDEFTFTPPKWARKVRRPSRARRTRCDGLQDRSR